MTAIETVHVARKRRRCDRISYCAVCSTRGIESGWILPGERYTRAALPPNDRDSDVGNETWWTLSYHVGPGAES